MYLRLVLSEPSAAGSPVAPKEDVETPRQVWRNRCASGLCPCNGGRQQRVATRPRGLARATRSSASAGRHCAPARPPLPASRFLRLRMQRHRNASRQRCAAIRDRYRAPAAAIIATAAIKRLRWWTMSNVLRRIVV